MEVNESSIFIAGSHRSPRGQVEWTVREYARLEKVDPKTVRRWIAKEALVVRRTPGGHIRIIGTR